MNISNFMLPRKFFTIQWTTPPPILQHQLFATDDRATLCAVGSEGVAFPAEGHDMLPTDFLATSEGLTGSGVVLCSSSTKWSDLTCIRINSSTGHVSILCVKSGGYSPIDKPIPTKTMLNAFEKLVP